MLEAKAKDQEHWRKCSSKKRSSKNFLSGDLQKRKTKKSSQWFREVSGVFLHNFKNEQIPTIVGADAKAHHTMWESSDINPRIENLLVYCATADLNFCNVGNKPTFRTKTREKVLDLTLVNRCAWDQVVAGMLAHCYHSRITCTLYCYTTITCKLGSRLKAESKTRLKCFEMFVARAGTSMKTNSNKNQMNKFYHQYQCLPQKKTLMCGQTRFIQ